MDRQTLPGDEHGIYIQTDNPVIVDLRRQIENLRQQLATVNEAAGIIQQERNALEREKDRMAFFIDTIVWTDGPGLSSICTHCGCRYDADRHEPGCPYGAWAQGAFYPSRGIVK